MANVRLSEEHIEAAMQACCRAVGVSSLNTKQKEAISSFLKGRDVFVCLPTGYGKSLCFVLLPLVCDYLRGRKNGSIVMCVSLDFPNDGVESQIHSLRAVCGVCR